MTRAGQPAPSFELHRLANAAIEALREADWKGGHAYLKGPPQPKPHNPGSSAFKILGAGQTSTVVHTGEEYLLIRVMERPDLSLSRLYRLTSKRLSTILHILEAEGHVCHWCARNHGRLVTAHGGCALSQVVGGRGDVFTDAGALNIQRGYSRRHAAAALSLAELLTNGPCA